MKFLDDLDFSVDDVPESLPAEAAGATVSSSTPAAGGASSGSGAAAAGSAPAAPPTEAEKRRSLEQTLEGEKEAEDALKFLNGEFINVSGELGTNGGLIVGRSNLVPSLPPSISSLQI